MSTRKTRLKKPKTVRRVPRVKKASPLLMAAEVGIAPEQVLDFRTMPATEMAHADVPYAPARPPVNLPLDNVSTLGVGARLNAPLMPARTSFWLGVGFGMLVVGTLMFLAWELFQVETVQAVVLSLTRSQ